MAVRRAVPRRAAAPAALALLLSLVAPAHAQSLTVATVGQLRSALQSSTEHILITDHLNFTASQDSSPVTVKGKCDTPLPKSEVFVAVQGRCVIDVPGPFLQAEGQDLLLSNVHVRLVRPPTATRQVTLVSLTAGSLWILDSQFDGTGAGANTRGFEVFPDRQLYMRDATVAGFNSSSPGAEGGAGVLLRTSARARFRATNFLSNRAALQRGAAMFLQSGTSLVSTAAWVSGGRFTETAAARGGGGQREKVFIAVGPAFAHFYMDTNAVAKVWTPRTNMIEDPESEEEALREGGFLMESQLRNIVDAQAALLGVDPIPLQEGEAEQAAGGGDDNTTAIIIGSVVAAVVLIAALGVVALLALRHKRRASAATSARATSQAGSIPHSAPPTASHGHDPDSHVSVLEHTGSHDGTIASAGAKLPTSAKAFPGFGGDGAGGGLLTPPPPAHLHQMGSANSSLRGVSLVESGGSYTTPQHGGLLAAHGAGDALSPPLPAGGAHQSSATRNMLTAESRVSSASHHGGPATAPLRRQPPPGSPAAAAAMLHSSFPSATGTVTSANVRSNSGAAPVASSGGQRSSSQPPQPKIRELEAALDEMYAHRAPFLGRFLFLGHIHRRRGGQGIIQFASRLDGGGDVAIKFFSRAAAFEREETLYTREALRSMMPAVVQMERNAGGRVRSPSGWAFPPCIVVEKGESLDEWALRIVPDFPTVLTVLCHIATRLQQLHLSGYVHRDIKPANVLWRPAHHSWTLIDFGCAAESGTTAPLTLSLTYAAPEALGAYEAGQRTITCDAAADMWALGMVAYELLSTRRVFKRSMGRAEIHDQLAGRAPLPWEYPDLSFRPVRELRILRRSVLACLSRDARERPTSTELLKMWNNLFDSVTRESTVEHTEGY